MKNRAPKETHFDATLRLNQHQAARVAELAENTVKFCTQPPSESTFTEGMALASATMKRTAALQASWTKDWINWMSFAQSIQGADTVPKYLDRMGNIYLQAEAQMASQVSEASELVDNIGVSYAYWLRQQVDREE